MDVQTPSELINPNYWTAPLSGIGYEPGWERQDPSNVIKVGDLYYVWYSKFSPDTSENWGYDGTIYYATSPDGWHWKECGQALDRGAADAWDSYGVITPYVVVTGGKYYLFYTGTRAENPWKLRGTLRHTGVAISDRPDGPWVRYEGNPVLSPGTGNAWDSLLVDDVHIIIREGKFWLYYKGGNPQVTAETTQWGLAVADGVTGPYIKHPGNPVLGSGHCVCVWPHREGVAALVDNAGPEKFTVQYSADGVHFQRTAKLDHVDIGCAPYDPDAFTNTKQGRGISWGVAACRKNNLMHIIRFGVDCEVGVAYPDHAADRKARAVRAKLLSDPHRPGYHIVPPEGFANPMDPNGALFWKDRYHLMYIIQTEKGHCWAHISSKDLLHWRHHPPALEPGGADGGIFSGGAFVDRNGVPTISYWGVFHPEKFCGICLATSTDDELDHWVKSPHNPVIAETEFGLTVDPAGRVYGAADPSAIWSHKGRYYLLTGNLMVLHKYGLHLGQDEHKGDTAYLFVSDDLVHWTYLHPFYTSDRRWTQVNEDNMCPDFFPLGDRHVLLFISHNLGCQYYIGRYENDHFYPETHGRMTWADRFFFAPESMADGKGRRIMWSWIFDGRKPETQRASGWSGALSLPRVLWLGEDKTLRLGPPEELALLRYNHRQVGTMSVAGDVECLLKDVWGNSIEIALEITAETARQYGLSIRCSPDGEEQTTVYYDAVEKKLCVDTRRSSLNEEGPKSVEAGPLDLQPGEPLRLRVFIDRSVVEVFANDRQAVMRPIYPSRADSLGVRVFSRGGGARVVSCEAWDMAPSNPW